MGACQTSSVRPSPPHTRQHEALFSLQRFCVAKPTGSSPGNTLQPNEFWLEDRESKVSFQSTLACEGSLRAPCGKSPELT